MATKDRIQIVRFEEVKKKDGSTQYVPHEYYFPLGRIYSEIKMELTEFKNTRIFWVYGIEEKEEEDETKFGSEIRVFVLDKLPGVGLSYIFEKPSLFFDNPRKKISIENFKLLEFYESPISKRNFVLLWDPQAKVLPLYISEVQSLDFKLLIELEISYPPAEDAASAGRYFFVLTKDKIMIYEFNWLLAEPQALNPPKGGFDDFFELVQEITLVETGFGGVEGSERKIKVFEDSLLKIWYLVLVKENRYLIYGSKGITFQKENSEEEEIIEEITQPVDEANSPSKSNETGEEDTAESTPKPNSHSKYWREYEITTKVSLAYTKFLLMERGIISDGKILNFDLQSIKSPKLKKFTFQNDIKYINKRNFSFLIKSSDKNIPFRIYTSKFCPGNFVNSTKFAEGNISFTGFETMCKLNTDNEKIDLSSPINLFLHLYSSKNPSELFPHLLNKHSFDIDPKSGSLYCKKNKKAPIGFYLPNKEENPASGMNYPNPSLQFQAEGCFRWPEPHFRPCTNLSGCRDCTLAPSCNWNLKSNSCEEFKPNWKDFIQSSPVPLSGAEFMNLASLKAKRSCQNDFLTAEMKEKISSGYTFHLETSTAYPLER